MSIYYRKITVTDTEPSAPSNGEVWIKPFEDSYQAYLYFNGWRPVAMSGGQFIAETPVDTQYLNVIIQEATPTDANMTGWIWLKESTLQAFICLFGEVQPIAVGA